MKKIILVISLAVFVTACTGERKRVTQSIDYSHPYANKSQYDFASYEPSALLIPSITAEPDGQNGERELGEDEDFTSDNISGSYGSYGDVVITVATRKFKLGPQATRKEMTRFQQAIDSAYNVALRQYRPTGFTYAISSVGAVNPLSDLQVTCKMGEQSANAVGQAACTQFFRNVASSYMQLTKEAE